MSSTSNKEPRRAVAPAGGDGSRLRELTHRVSRVAGTKQFCHSFGRKSLLGHNRERIDLLFGAKPIRFRFFRVPRKYRVPQASNTRVPGVNISRRRRAAKLFQATVLRLTRLLANRFVWSAVWTRMPYETPVRMDRFWKPAPRHECASQPGYLFAMAETGF